MAKKVRVEKDYCLEKCPSECCKDLTIQILKPRNREEVEDLKWQLQFDTVRVYLLRKRWYMLVKGRCMYLGSDNRCRIYDKRPERCRRHNPPGCERFGRYYDVMLNTPEDLERHLGREKRRSSLKGKK